MLWGVFRIKEMGCTVFNENYAGQDLYCPALSFSGCARQCRTKGIQREAAMKNMAASQIKIFHHGKKQFFVWSIKDACINA